MPDFIYITTLNGLQELYIVKPLLQEEGIKFYIKNENMLQMNPLSSVGTGGMDVMVESPDAQRAYDILKEAGYIIEEREPEITEVAEADENNEEQAPTAKNTGEPTHCPFCKSDEIRRERSRRFLVIWYLIIGVPVPTSSWIYRCFDCGKLFEKDGTLRKYN